MKHLLILAAALAMLTACQEAPSAYRPGPFAFEQPGVNPTRIAVAKIDTIDHFTPPLKRPHVEHEFVISPAKAIDAWLDHRIQAAGNSGTLEITINDASVIETPLTKTEGLKGLFTDDQDARYDAHLSVTFRVYDGTNPLPRATGAVEVKRYITLNEKATVFERQQRFHEMLRALMVDFDREASTRLQQYFGGFIGG